VTQVRPAPAGCPVAFGHQAAPPPGLAMEGFQRVDAWRAQNRPAVWSEDGPGYWVFTDGEVILSGLQQPELWSSRVMVPNEPDPPYRWIPIMLDPPEHTPWRRLLGGYLSPGRVKKMADGNRALAIEIIGRFRDRGECEFMTDFARVFPSTIFLQVMGMPIDKLEEFMSWEDMILHQDSQSDPDMSIRMNGMMAVMGYFGELIAERRAHPVEDAEDIVSDALGWQIDGKPVEDADVLNCLLLLFMAGLDTVASQLSYALLHLATHPDDRKRIVSDPSIVPHALEELMRAFPIVATGRVATQDMDFHGCPVKAGDTAQFPLAMAGRDEKAWANATSVDFDREDVRHISFGAGPHRCLGSHLARQELVIVLEEWHRLIPDYELVGTPTEHAGGVSGLNELQLRWTP
jgi:cytochrome P450